MSERIDGIMGSAPTEPEDYPETTPYEDLLRTARAVVKAARASETPVALMYELYFSIEYLKLAIEQCEKAENKNE